MRKYLITIVCCLCLLIVPVVLLIVGLFLPAQFSNTYYGELSIMYTRLKNTEGKKIVVIGNSAVAFGVDSALLEEELNKNGYEYTVCNFGLYGALGTKLILVLFAVDAVAVVGFAVWGVCVFKKEKMSKSENKN